MQLMLRPAVARIIYARSSCALSWQVGHVSLTLSFDCRFRTRLQVALVAVPFSGLQSQIRVACGTVACASLDTWVAAAGLPAFALRPGLRVAPERRAVQVLRVGQGVGHAVLTLSSSLLALRPDILAPFQVPPALFPSGMP